MSEVSSQQNSESEGDIVEESFRRRQPSRASKKASSVTPKVGKTKGRDSSLSASKRSLFFPAALSESDVNEAGSKGVFNFLVDKFERNFPKDRPLPLVPLCRLVHMHVVRPLQTESKHLEDMRSTFLVFGYTRGLANFHVSTRDAAGNELFLTEEVKSSWDESWVQQNPAFEAECDEHPELFGWLKNRLLACWDGNHRRYCWMMVADEFPRESKYHPRVECIILEHTVEDMVEITQAMHSRNALAGCNIKGSWLQEAERAKEVLSHPLADYRKLLGDQFDAYVKEKAPPILSWYTANMPQSAAIHILSIATLTSEKHAQALEEAQHLSKSEKDMSKVQKEAAWAKRFSKATSTWRTLLPKYAVIMNPRLGVDFWNIVKKISFLKQDVPGATLVITPDATKVFAGASIPNDLRNVLVEAHFGGDEGTWKKYHHPAGNIETHLRGWLQRWSLWAQVESLGVQQLRTVLEFEIDKFGSEDWREQVEDIVLSYTDYVSSVCDTNWDILWYSAQTSKPSIESVIGRAKRTVFRFFVMRMQHFDYFDNRYKEHMPGCFSHWVEQESPFTMWTEDPEVRIVDEWEFQNCPWYADMEWPDKAPCRYADAREAEAYALLRGPEKDESSLPDPWFDQEKVAGSEEEQEEMAVAVELTRDPKELERTVEGFMIDKSRTKRKKSDNDKPGESSKKKGKGKRKLGDESEETQPGTGKKKEEISVEHAEASSKKKKVEPRKTETDSKVDVAEVSTKRQKQRPKTTTDAGDEVSQSDDEEGVVKTSKHKKKSEDGSMRRPNLTLPPPVPRFFVKSDFESTQAFMLAEDAKKKRNPKHVRKTPPIVDAFKQLCSTAPRASTKGFRILGGPREFAADCIIFDVPTNEMVRENQSSVPAWNMLDETTLEDFFKFASNILDDRGCIILFHGGSIRHCQVIQDSLDNFSGDRGFNILKSYFVYTDQPGYIKNVHNNIEQMWISRVEVLIRKNVKPMPYPKMGGKVSFESQAQFCPISGNIIYNDLESQYRGKAELGCRRKTVDFMQTLFELTTKPGEIILDCVAGYGASYLAAHNCGRYVCGMERRSETLKESCKTIISELEVEDAPKQKSKVQVTTEERRGKKPVADEDCEALFDFTVVQGSTDGVYSDTDNSSHPHWVKEHIQRENIKQLFVSVCSPAKEFFLPPHIAVYADRLVTAEKERRMIYKPVCREDYQGGVFSWGARRTRSCVSSRTTSGDISVAKCPFIDDEAKEVSGSDSSGSSGADFEELSDLGIDLNLASPS